MKYRIKIFTYGNGRQEFAAEVKTFWGWRRLYSNGEQALAGSTSVAESRDNALNRIDLHWKGNTRVAKIEIEYVTKETNV